MRVIGEMHKERFRERVKDVPEELREYHDTEMLMNSNSTALHNLYKEAKDHKKYQEAFLYFFYEFEIVLKHMIMSEMMIVNNLAPLESREENFFSVYPREKVNRIQKIGHISELIETFCLMHGNEIKDDLKGINDARNFIIHNMLKEEMSEEQIKKAFEHFFTAAGPYIKNSYKFFDKTLEERPKKLLFALEKLAREKGINIKHE